MNLEKIKENLKTYNYPWVNIINNKTFTSRNLLLIDLKKYLNKNEYKYVYPQKYVFIEKYFIEDIIKNTKVDDINKKILSPFNKKWYKYNNILSHFSCFLDKKNKINMIYEIFKYNNLLPKCQYLNIELTKNDIRKGREVKTPHPNNHLFNKYSHTLTKDDYKKIHSNVLLSSDVIKKKLLKHKEFLADKEKVTIWKEKMKITHNNMEHPWLTDMDDKERKRRNLKSSNSQKKNILEGKFTPQNNYRTKRRIKLEFNNKTYYFRSSWEVCFYISNQHLKYETLRIEYNKNNETKIYIPDFIDDENKILYELKPKRQYISQIDKMNGAIKWCLENEYKFIWINEYNLINYINKELFTNELYLSFYNKMIKGIKTND